MKTSVVLSFLLEMMRTTKTGFFEILIGGSLS